MGMISDYMLITYHPHIISTRYYLLLQYTPKPYSNYYCGSHSRVWATLLLEAMSEQSHKLATNSVRKEAERRTLGDTALGMCPRAQVSILLRRSSGLHLSPCDSSSMLLFPDFAQCLSVFAAPPFAPERLNNTTPRLIVARKKSRLYFRA